MLEMITLAAWLMGIFAIVGLLQLVVTKLAKAFGVEISYSENQKANKLGTEYNSTGYPMDEGASIDYGGFVKGDSGNKHRWSDD
jgi:hypothetical protein